MTNKRCILVFSILVVTAVAASACFSAPVAAPTEGVPPTVTPVAPAAPSLPKETSTPLPTGTPKPTDKPAPGPTDTPAPTVTATATTEPTSTLRPQPPKSTGPLDFPQPEWVYMWEKQPDGNVKVVVKVEITGGAPPFTIKHDGNVVGKTWERLFLLDFLHLGCSGIGHTITVESADGQSVTHDYWLQVDRLDWCK
jgi:hypothetical protein